MNGARILHWFNGKLWVGQLPAVERFRTMLPDLVRECRNRYIAISD